MSQVADPDQRIEAIERIADAYELAPQAGATSARQ